MKKQINEFFPGISFASMTEQGMIRKNNEDSIMVLPEDGCFVVADGMGGAEAGEIASAFVVASIRDALDGSCNESPGERKYILQQSLQKAHCKIECYAKEHRYSSMGSTVALLLFNSWDSQKALVCHVGDSRVYCFHNGELFRITEDHNIASEMLRENKSADSRLQNSSLKSLLTRSIGAQHPLFPEWTELSVCKDDIFLLCSDGVSSMLSDENIESIICSGKIPEQIINDLRSAVFQKGAQDNFSVICIKINELPKAFTPDMIELRESNYLLKISEERTDYGTI